MKKWSVIQGDVMELLPTMKDNSIDSVVTDPPYEIDFMGKHWDRAGVSFQVETWERAIRILKPGGHLLAFGGTRTYHRLVCAIEDAGFEIRDSIHWIYGSGFPKNLDVGKAIDKGKCIEREIISYQRQSPRAFEAGYESSETTGKGKRGGKFKVEDDKFPITAPASAAAKQWNGWGTALKPAHEPIVVARKPLEGTVAQNVQKWGTGGINIDDCRVSTDNDCSRKPAAVKPGSIGYLRNDMPLFGGRGHDKGRWPPNVILDESAAAELDRQSGELKSGEWKGEKGGDTGGAGIYGKREGQHYFRSPDSGGASRFFPVFRYKPKASRSERDAGLSDRNNHPTVKSIALMQWLCRLITPPGGLILDPFAGSGTTGIAAIREDFSFIGIEINPEYVEMAKNRIVQDAPLFNTKNE